MRTRAILTRVFIGVTLLAGGGGIMSGSTSCASSPDRTRATFLLLPDFQTYKESVDPYLQKRCGTLDCHGQPGRPYRLYGFSGIRDQTEEGGSPLVSGQQPTTPGEVVSNYQATIGLEPEEMSRVVARQGQNPNTLIFLRKPLKIERHKGGQLMTEDDVGYRCVTAWLRIRTVRLAGEDTEDPGAIETIPEEERLKLSAKDKDFCAKAAANP
ncbi:MAG: hypothetical protein U0270_13970 [Labilithrix sp.]